MSGVIDIYPVSAAGGLNALGISTTVNRPETQPPPPLLVLLCTMTYSERPRSLLLSLGGAIQTLAWVLSWARPGPIPGPRWSRPDSPCALFYSVSDPSRSRGGGHPGPSWSHPAPERSLQDRAWTGRNRLLGHFRYIPQCRPYRYETAGLLALVSR